MITPSHTYCLILAGGSGRRLWPVSRTRKPKQFVDFFNGGRTLLQMTYDRFARLLPPEQIYVSTYVEYAPLVQEQLPELPAENILREPAQLSSGPAALWASTLIHHFDEEATLIVTPSDQLVITEETFYENIALAESHVRETSDILFIGAVPTVANTTYGYIQKGKPAKDDLIYDVKSFSEKPDAQFAQIFLESGEFLWNTGLIVWRTATIQAKLPQLMPLMAEQCAALSAETSVNDWRAHIERYYPAANFTAIDLLLLEHTEGVRVLESYFGWVDVGSWSELHQAIDADADGNTVVSTSKVLFNGSSNNTVHLPAGMAAVIKGLDGYLVSVQDNVLVICPNEEAATVRNLQTEAQVKLGEEYV